MDARTKAKKETKKIMVPRAKNEKRNINDYANHCVQKWSEYPCRLGWRHGCKNGICWSQCHGAWLLAGDGEWCYVQKPRDKVKEGLLTIRIGHTLTASVTKIVRTTWPTATPAKAPAHWDKGPLAESVQDKT